MPDFLAAFSGPGAGWLTVLAVVILGTGAVESLLDMQAWYLHIFSEGGR